MRSVFVATLVAVTNVQAQSQPSADTVGASWEYDSQLGRYRVEVIATGVRVPFGMAFLPDSRHSSPIDPARSGFSTLARGP